MDEKKIYESHNWPSAVQERNKILIQKSSPIITKTTLEYKGLCYALDEWKAPRTYANVNKKLPALTKTWYKTAFKQWQRKLVSATVPLVRISFLKTLNFYVCYLSLRSNLHSFQVACKSLLTNRTFKMSLSTWFSLEQTRQRYGSSGTN